MHNILLSVTDRETLLFFIIVSRKYFCIYGNSSTFLIIIQLFDYYIIIFTVFLRFLFICHTRWVRFHATNNDWLLSRKDLQNSQEILLPEHFTGRQSKRNFIYKFYQRDSQTNRFLVNFAKFLCMKNTSGRLFLHFGIRQSFAIEY